MKEAHEGDQLELWSNEQLLVGGARLPWGGRSPRALTRGYKSIKLNPSVKSVSGFVDPEQYDLWLPVQKAPWRYQGAPSLLDLPRRLL